MFTQIYTAFDLSLTDGGISHIMDNNRTMDNPLGSQPITALLRRFAIPSIIAMVVSALYNIVDQIFIGQSVGMLGNAATNVAFPLTTVYVSLALLCGIGGAANFNLFMGAKETDKAKKIIGSAISMMVVFGIVLLIVTQLFLEPMMKAFGATELVLDYALTYTGITSLGFPFVLLTTGGSNLIRADGSPVFSMVCTLTGAVLNTILDPIFIFVFDMGVAGAAYATVIGQVVSAVMVILYLTRFKTVKLSLRDLIPNFKYWILIISLGLTPFFNQVAMMVVQIVLNNTLTYYGALSEYGSEIPLANAGIISKVGMIFFSIIIGIAQGLQPIVSFNYGAKKYSRVLEALTKAIKICALISVLAFFCFQIFPRQIISFFGTGSEEYFRFAERYFRIYMFFTFVIFIQPLSSNFFTSIGKPGRGVFLSLTRQIIFLLPLLLFLPMFFGIEGVMFAAPIADFFATVVSIILVGREFVKLKRINLV